MRYNIEIQPGATAWKRAGRLLAGVWPADVVATLPVGNITWARPDRCVLVSDEAGHIVCHAGIYTRAAKWDGRGVNIGGIGAVATRADRRRRGIGTAAVKRAMEDIQDAGGTGGADFGLLFCEPHNQAFYRRLGWRGFAGEVLIAQRSGVMRFDILAPLVLDFTLAPRTGMLELCGPPW